MAVATESAACEMEESAKPPQIGASSEQTPSASSASQFSILNERSAQSRTSAAVSSPKKRSSEALNRIELENKDSIQVIDESANEETNFLSNQALLPSGNTAAELVGSGSTQLTQNSSTPWTSKPEAKREIMCRICHSEETSEEFLISPCYCNGTLRFVHQSCLQQWLRTHGIKSCELCKFDFIMQTKIQPFKNWKKLHINSIERRKIFCSVIVNFIVVVAFLWSLFVLINNTAKDIAIRPNEWDFWAKLVLAAIGCTGGAIFMYIQCKTYYHLCLRWRQHNRIIVIQPITEEMLKKSNKPKQASLSKKSQDTSPDTAATAPNANPNILTSNFIYPISNSSTTFNVTTIDEETPASNQAANVPASKPPC